MAEAITQEADQDLEVPISVNAMSRAKALRDGKASHDSFLLTIVKRQFTGEMTKSWRS